MRHEVEIEGLDESLTETERDLALTMSAAIGEATVLLKGELRADVEQAGLGSKLALAWRSETFPKSRPSLDAAGWIWTKAPKLIDVFDRGVTIRSREGFWLAIPTAAAGRTGLKRGGGREARITPGGFERRTGLRLRLVYRRGKTALLVVDNSRLNKRGEAASNTGRSRGGGAYTRLSGRTTIVVFILVPQVRLRKRLNLNVYANRADARMPGLLTKHWRA